MVCVSIRREVIDLAHLMLFEIIYVYVYVPHRRCSVKCRCISIYVLHFAHHCQPANFRSKAVQLRIKSSGFIRYIHNTSSTFNSLLCIHPSARLNKQKKSQTHNQHYGMGWFDYRGQWVTVRRHYKHTRYMATKNQKSSEGEMSGETVMSQMSITEPLEFFREFLILTARLQDQI